MKISVCIPIFNPGEDYFRLLDSLAQNARSNLEFEFVILETIGSKKDECIESRTREKLKGLNLIYQTIKKAEFAHGSGRNKLIDLATGDYLLFCTQDIIIDKPFKIDAEIDYIKSNGIHAICAIHHSPIRAFKKIFEKMFARQLTSEEFTEKEDQFGRWWSNCFAIYSRTILTKYRFPAVHFSEDFLWRICADSGGYKTKVTNRISITHLNHETFKSALNRGKLEGLGLAETRFLLDQQLTKLSVWRSLLGRLLMYLMRDSALLNICSIASQKAYLNDLIQIIGKVWGYNNFRSSINRKIVKNYKTMGVVRYEK